MNSEFYFLVERLERQANAGKEFADRAIDHEWLSKDFSLLAEGLNGIWMSIHLLTMIVAYGLESQFGEDLLGQLFGTVDPRELGDSDAKKL